MNEKNKLMLQMGIFFILVFGIFTYIVLNEKKTIILTPKVEEKILQYIDNNYATEKSNLDIGKIKYIKDKNTYQIKLSNTKNKNLYFYVKYKKKKITSTYKKDYIEGNSLYNSFENKYKNDINNIKVNFTNKLNKYPTTIRNQIINEDIKTLPIYNIEKELTIEKHAKDDIITAITNFYNQNKELGYNPKEYTLTIVDKNDISFAVKIENLTENLITNNINEIISAIIKNDSNIKTKYSINYNYIN